MTRATGRILIAAFVCVAFTFGGAVGVVAADHGEDDYDADLTLEGDVDSSYVEGNGTYDCIGDVTLRHHCDKDAQVDAGVVSVEYFGDNFARPSELVGGGGDVVIVEAASENATVGFDCDLRTPPEQDCSAVTDEDDYDGDPE